MKCLREIKVAASVLTGFPSLSCLRAHLKTDAVVERRMSLMFVGSSSTILSHNLIFFFS